MDFTPRTTAELISDSLGLGQLHSTTSNDESNSIPLTQRNMATLLTQLRPILNTIGQEEDQVQQEELIRMLCIIIHDLCKSYDVPIAPVEPEWLTKAKNKKKKGNDEVDDAEDFDPDIGETDSDSDESIDDEDESDDSTLETNDTDVEDDDVTITTKKPAKSSKKSAEKSAKKKSGNKLAEKSAEKSAKKSAEKKAEKSAEKSLKKQLSKLEPVTMSISTDYNIEILTEQRNRFFQALRILKAPGKKNLKDHEFTFSKRTARELTNFMFDQLMGVKAYNRLIKLIETYYDRDTIGVTEKSMVKALQLSLDQNVPNEIRSVYKQIASLSGSNLSVKNQLSVFYLNIKYLTLYQEYQNLLTACRDRPKEIKHYMQTQGFQTKHSITLQNVIVSFLATHIQCDTRKLTTLTQKGKALAQMTEVFGSGVLPLLSKVALNRLHRFGNFRMQAALPVFAEIVTCFSPMCQIIDRCIYQPIRNAEPITMTKPRSINKKTTFAQRILDASGEDLEELIAENEPEQSDDNQLNESSEKSEKISEESQNNSDEEPENNDHDWEQSSSTSTDTSDTSEEDTEMSGT